MNVFEVPSLPIIYCYTAVWYINLFQVPSLPIIDCYTAVWYMNLFQVPSLPVIDWEKYTNNLDFSNIGLHRHMTRLKRQLVDGSGGEAIVKILKF